MSEMRYIWFLFNEMYFSDYLRSVSISLCFETRIQFFTARHILVKFKAFADDNTNVGRIALFFCHMLENGLSDYIRSGCVFRILPDAQLTLYKTTYFRFVQIESICRRQFQCGLIGDICL